MILNNDNPFVLSLLFMETITLVDPFHSVVLIRRYVALQRRNVFVGGIDNALSRVVRWLLKDS